MRKKAARVGTAPFDSVFGGFRWGGWAYNFSFGYAIHAPGTGPWTPLGFTTESFAQAYAYYINASGAVAGRFDPSSGDSYGFYHDGTVHELPEGA